MWSAAVERGHVAPAVVRRYAGTYENRCGYVFFSLAPRDGEGSVEQGSRKNGEGISEG